MSTSLRELVGSETAEFHQLRSAVAQERSRRYAGGWRFTSSEPFRVLKAQDDASCRSSLLRAFVVRQDLLEAVDSFVSRNILGSCLTHFSRSRLGWSAEEVAAVIAATNDLEFTTYQSMDEYRFAIGLAEQLSTRGPLNQIDTAYLQGFRDRIANWSDSTHGSSTDDLASLLARLRDLVPQLDPDDELGVIAISDSEPYGRLAFEVLRSFVGVAGLRETLVHITRPPGSASWRKETIRRDQTAPLLRTVARALVAALERTDLSQTWNLSPSSVTLIKGAAAALGVIGDASDAELLERTVIASAPLAQGLYASGAPTRACIAALGELAVDEASSALTRLQSRYRSGDLKKRIAAALDVAAERSGFSPGELIERRVDGAMLDVDHSRTIGNSEVAAELRVTATGAITTWLSHGTPIRSLTEQLKEEHPDVVAEVRAAGKALSTAWTAQRLRLEGLFAEGRQWSIPDWTSLYRDHSLVGPMVGDLIWQAQTDGSWSTFLGADHLPVAAETLRLWHPLDARDDEIEHWRDEILRRQIRQPFKQAYREHYVLTPAERESRTSSARFAQHVVRVDQLFALMKGRGWQAKWLGTFGSGWEATPRLVLAEGRYRVGLDLELAHEQGWDDCAITGAAHFDRLTGKSWRQVDLDQVPPLVFSEAMRDIDLFVTVANVTTDPTWRERRLQGPAQVEAWDLQANSALTQVGEVRRAVIARLLPELKIAKQCSLDDRSLRVRGTLGEYAINLTTANVMILPRNQFVCITRGSSGAARGVFLPFDGDELLSLILSKAVMLAADHKIKDDSILRQIRR